VEQFLLDRGVNYFSLVPTSGALEVAPAMGSADVIADITETGTTIRENRLKILHGGMILDSQACLIINTASVGRNSSRLAAVHSMIDAIENRLQTKGLYEAGAAKDRL
jgi:ATP phosphoribosyltransferase